MAMIVTESGAGILSTQTFLIIELLCLLILALITVFRKKLSSNDEYRNEVIIPLDFPASNEIVTGQSRTLVGGMGKGRNSKVDIIHEGAISIRRLSSDENLLLNIVAYLPDSDIKMLALSSKSFFKDCTTDFIWEQLWTLTFGVMWNDDNFKEIRKIRGINWNPGGNQNTDFCELSGTVYNELGVCQNMRKTSKPLQGWLNFYMEFEYCWMDWLMAGCCTPEYSIIGLYGSLYNITNFLPDHPGSLESLTEASGGDGTDIFSDIGHSSFATSLADMFLLWGVGQKSKQSQAKQLRTPTILRQYSQHRPNRFQVKMKRDRFFAERLLLKDNFVVKSADCESRTAQGSLPNLGNSEVLVEEMEGTPTIAHINDDADVVDVGLVTSSISTWPMGVNLNMKLSLNLALRLDNLSSSLSLQKSVLSITESVFLAKAKAGNFLKRGLLGNRLRDRTPVKPMAPSLFEGKAVCQLGCKHRGRLRMLYDPLELQWWGWWTCCGQGELAIDIREEETLCAEVAEQYMSYKIC